MSSDKPLSQILHEMEPVDDEIETGVSQAIAERLNKRPVAIGGSADAAKIAETSPANIANTKRGTEALLDERAKTHGDYADHARVTQNLKAMMQAEGNYSLLSSQHREALEMIQHKIGRILAGDPNFNDHWDDIAGYATLGSKACKRAKAAP